MFTPVEIPSDEKVSVPIQSWRLFCKCGGNLPEVILSPPFEIPFKALARIHSLERALRRLGSSSN